MHIDEVIRWVSENSVLVKELPGMIQNYVILLLGARVIIKEIQTTQEGYLLRFERW